MRGGSAGNAGQGGKSAAAGGRAGSGGLEPTGGFDGGMGGERPDSSDGGTAGSNAMNGGSTSQTGATGGTIPTMGGTMNGGTMNGGTTSGSGGTLPVAGAGGTVSTSSGGAPQGGKGSGGAGQGGAPQGGTGGKPCATGCLIGGTCYNQNQADPSNPCRFCDTTQSASAWSNSPRTTTCDDGLWCNGADTCNGSGACAHEFANGNRCTGTGACDVQTCSEQTKTCFAPNSKVCSTTQEKQCGDTTSCSGQIQTRTVTRYCSGNSSACNGTAVNSNWQNSSTCPSDQKCGGSGTCSADVSCVAWCDQTSGLCWQRNAPTSQPIGPADAKAYCDGLTLGGKSNWRLPTFAEWVHVYRGCQDTVRASDTALSTCNLSTDKQSLINCGACEANAGPDQASGGCYVAKNTVPVNCTGTFSSYWTSDMYDSTNYWMAYLNTGTGFPSSFVAAYALCVVPK